MQNKTKHAIPGYTGFQPSQELDQDNIQLQGFANQIPGYQGFVPAIKSENLYGKTFGKTTLLSSTGHHHKGGDVPPNIRYTSTIQEAFVDQRHQKNNDISLYNHLDDKTSTALAYTLSNLTHLDNHPKKCGEREYHYEQKTGLTFEHAKHIALSK